MQGTTIDKYLLEAVLGSGGMGTVYRARHLMLGRSAAVKLLLPELSADAGFVQRFFNEARAASSVHHLGIVEVYDYGRMADGVAYIAMELLHGETLARRIQRGLDAVSALRFARLICGALGAAHDRGIVHRDLKPDNVFIIRDDEITGGERIKLLDFGIAKLTLDPAWTASHQTRTGTLIGTPAYMAPEQCRGVEIDWRADIYALGCILYEVFAGRPPFRGDGVGDVLGAHMYLPPTPIADIQPAVWHLIERMLAKQPADRPQTTGQIIGAIDDLLAAGIAPTIAPRTPAARGDVQSTETVPCKPPALAASTVMLPLAPALPPTPAPSPLLLADRVAGDRIAGSHRAIDSARITEVLAGRAPAAPDPPAAGSPVVVGDPSPPSAAPTVVQRPVPRRRKRMLAIAALLGSVGIAVAIETAGSRTDSSTDAGAPHTRVPGEVALTPIEPRVEPPPRAAPAPVIAPAPSAPVPTAPASTTPITSIADVQLAASIHVRLDSTPRGSHVLLDGRKIGTTPYETRLPRSDRALIFTLRRAGFQDTQLEVRGDADIDRSLVLTPGRSTLPSSKPARRPRRVGSDEEINPFAP